MSPEEKRATKIEELINLDETGPRHQVLALFTKPKVFLEWEI